MVDAPAGDDRFPGAEGGVGGVMDIVGGVGSPEREPVVTWKVALSELSPRATFVAPA
jgi:hypothetical protein